VDGAPRSKAGKLPATLNALTNKNSSAKWEICDMLVLGTPNLKFQISETTMLNPIPSEWTLKRRQLAQLYLMNTQSIPDVN